MQELQNILVGVDVEHDDGALTDGSRVASRQALQLAARTGASVAFLHAIHFNPEDGPTRGAPPSDGAREELDALARQHLGRGADLTTAAEEPWIALVRRVLAGDADLVVVAKRNRTRRMDRRLGSVSMRLVRMCPAPVWAVRPDHPLRHRCILAATDLTPVGDMATRYGAFLAGVEGCRLLVVHAWQMPISLQLSSSRIPEREFEERKQEILEAARAHVLGVEGVSALGDAVDVAIAHDAPSHAILEAVAARDPDLVVLGTVSRGGIAGVLVGNTAERLVYHLDCSLLVVKPEDFVCPVTN